MSPTELQMIQELSNAMQTLATNLNKRLEALEQKVAKLEEGSNE